MRSTFATGSLLTALVIVLFLPGLSVRPLVEATARSAHHGVPEATQPLTPRSPARWSESAWLRPALASLRTGQWEDALRIVEASAPPREHDEDEQGRADFLRGLLLLRAGRGAEAVEPLEAAVAWADDRQSALRSRAWFHLGEAHETSREQALAARAFAKAGGTAAGDGPSSHALAPWAVLRQAEALAAAGDAQGSLAAHRVLLGDLDPVTARVLPTTGGGREADAADRRERAELRLTALARALPLAEASDTALAATLRRALLVEFPCSEAARALAATASLGSPGARLRLLGAEGMAERCENLVDDACEAAAVTDLTELLASKPGPPLADRAELLMGRALRGESQPKKALEHLRRVGLSDSQLLSRATWESAAASKTLGKRSEHRRLLRACAEGPASPWRDRAALSLAGDEAEAGRHATARELWRRVAADSADPSARVQAAWRAAWSQYRAGLTSAALLSFDSLVEGSPRRREAAAARYWAARIARDRGDAAGATARLVSLAADFPRDYYGIVAAEEAGDAAQASPASGDGCLSESLDHAQAESLARLARVDAGAAAVAAELLRLGLVDDALQELRHARVGEDAAAALARDESRTLALAIAGRRVAALRMFRECLPDWRSRADLSGAVWCAVYPLAYDDIVLSNCAERGLDPALVCGLIHQESVFEPQAVSWVGARGLMQVMPATGRTIARWFDERVTTPQLVEPERNVRYGTEYLARLLDEFGHAEVALAGYNAGGGRARRWWKQVGGKDLPLFVESIPFDETREYVKAIAWSSRLYREAWADALDAAVPEENDRPGPAVARR